MATPWERCWAGSAWRAEVGAWVDGALAAAGLTRTGELEVHKVRLWAVTLAAPTTGPRVWFKENCPGQWAEAGVVAALSEVAAEWVVPPLAVEPARGWLLSADQGPTLAEQGPLAAAAWEQLVTQYAALQRATVGQARLLAGVGLRSLEPGSAAGFVAQRVQRLADLPAVHPRRVGPELAARLRSRLPELDALGARLAGGPVPSCLEHNDLHHHNVFGTAVGPDALGPLRFFDLADAVWGHPFASLRVLLNVVAQETPDDLVQDTLARVVDAYLEGWADLAAYPVLRSLLDDALVLGRVHRFLSWDRCLQGVDPLDLGDHAEAPAVWLTTLANDLDGEREGL